MVELNVVPDISQCLSSSNLTDTERSHPNSVAVRKPWPDKLPSTMMTFPGAVLHPYQTGCCSPDIRSPTCQIPLTYIPLPYAKNSLPICTMSSVLESSSRFDDDDDEVRVRPLLHQSLTGCTYVSDKPETGNQVID